MGRIHTLTPAFSITLLVAPNNGQTNSRVYGSELTKYG